MKKNMGNTDRILRLVFSFIVGILAYYEIVEGALFIVLAIAAIIFAFTALINYCPLYSLLGIKTTPKEDSNCDNC